MTKFNSKGLLTFFAVLFLSLSVSAQVKIGSPSIPLNTDAVLDLSNTGSTGNNKGLLLPTVQLVSTNLASPLASMTAGMAVYNLLAAGSGATAVVPGMYLNNGTTWVLFTVATSSAATFVAGSLYGYGTTTGTYITNSATNGSNTQAFLINVATTGTYLATTDAQNGVTFSSSGTLSNTGTNMVVLSGSGTPTSNGSFTYTLTLGNQTYSFSITYSSLATFDFTQLTASQSSTGPLFLNTPYTGSLSIPYTNGNGATYPATSLQNNGLTLTREAGTFNNGMLRGGHNQVVYNLTGTYTGNTDYATFILPEGGTYTFGDAIHASLSDSKSAYASAAPNTWVSITTAEYANITSIISSVHKYYASDADLTTSSSITGAQSGSTYSANNIGTPTMAANNYPIAFAIRDDPNTAPTTMAGIQIKLGTDYANGYVNFPATVGQSPSTTPAPDVSITLAPATTYCFVLKSPTFITTNVTMCAVYVPWDYQGSLLQYSNKTDISLYFGTGNINDLPTKYTNALNIQMLATPNLNW